MRRFDQINVIPFIDIMLVLLAIVLTTATFIAQGQIKVSLPEAKSAAPADGKPAIVITLNAAGDVFVDDQATTLEALNTRLDTLKKDQAIVFRVDKKTAFGQFVAVIDALKTRGLDQLTIRTTSASEATPPA
ncbi:TonB system transport protein ExbD [Halothiobacillus sp.]|jgi:biopolymer transport protein ExbD|uniref:TonB system transport protein ExbD n=1 Tax=Halothiobacillus sp. TaxID=1891311 RepID=UPI0026045535|nr:TonB system transport protein ExbD [Halothiobacillus sp.]MDD4966673.1 TonB system transport protein ExbD [Halothiobacillus sp.]MDY0148316.1 TonB system transport protein ExbD [Halothiobacillus sp.]